MMMMMMRRTAPLDFAVLVFVAVKLSAEIDAQRPFYVIGHMANSLSTLDRYVERGVNAVEADLSFTIDGLPERFFHGPPCDLFRICTETTPFVDYLQAAAIRPLALLMIDVKASQLSDDAMTLAGSEIARQLVEVFWNASNANVVLSLPLTRMRLLIEAFVNQLSTSDSSKLEKVSYDVYPQTSIEDISKMYKELNITSAWQGDGTTNWFEFLRDASNLRKALELRDSGNSYMRKVYRWTVDPAYEMVEFIDMGVDGLITNRVDKAMKIVKANAQLRLATSEDPINEWFHRDKVTSKK